ncbi:hypothetical protein AC1031_004456 [Aphanomyces cochlioides]|nr:hypothetical protein AC1031_004456 [Aphanomyces cochlioides]
MELQYIDDVSRDERDASPLQFPLERARSMRCSAHRLRARCPRSKLLDLLLTLGTMAASLWTANAHPASNPTTDVVKVKHMEEVVCAGILIAPRYVLTTATCVTVEVENDVLDAIAAFVHPLYNVEQRTFNFVLLELDRAAAAPPAMLHFDVLAPRTQVVARGYSKFTDGTTISNVECAATNPHILDDLVCIDGVSLCDVKEVPPRLSRMDKKPSSRCSGGRGATARTTTCCMNASRAPRASWSPPQCLRHVVSTPASLS